MKCAAAHLLYTHVSIRMLKQVHSTTHPAASLDKKNAPLLPHEPAPAIVPQAEELFATLDAEAQEEEEE